MVDVMVMLFILFYYSTITFEGNSTTTFTNNFAFLGGGAVYVYFSTITFLGNSTVIFTKNDANRDHYGISFCRRYVHNRYDLDGQKNGGAIFLNFNSNIAFGENTTVMFDNNFASSKGGAMYIYGVLRL